jgi:hypothetical protein
MMARKSGEMQAIGPIFDEINRRVADAIGEAVQKGADPQAAIGAAWARRCRKLAAKPGAAAGVHPA